MSDRSDHAGEREIFRIEASSDAARAAQIAKELESHIAMHVEALMSDGMSEAEARAIAESRFGGGVERAARRLTHSARRRDVVVRSRMLAGGVFQDARLALRGIRQRPLSAFLTLLTFALAIGFLTSIFTVVDRVLLRPLPFPQSEQLVQIMSLDSAGRDFGGDVSARNWLDWRASNRTLAATGLCSTDYNATHTVGTGGSAARVPGYYVRGAFFETLRPRLLIGRILTDADMAAASGHPVVISERLWRGQLGASRDLRNLSVVVDGTPRTVVGVVAAGQEFPREADVWLPGYREPVSDEAREWLNWNAIARLAPGRSLDDAQHDVAGVTAGIHEASPRTFNAYGAKVIRLEDAVTAQARTNLWLLLGAIALVALISCVNLSAVNFARALARRDSVAVRLALGASRARVFAQLVTEQIVLSLLGGLLGLAVAWMMTGWIAQHSAGVIPRSTDVGMDLPIFCVGIALSFIAGVLAGAAPAWRVTRTSAASLVSSSRGDVSRGLGRAGRIVILAEVALSAALLFCSGLLIHSFRNVTHREIGFDPHGAVTATVMLSRVRYPDSAATQAYWRGLLERTSELPGITRFGLTGMPPGRSAPTGFNRIPGVKDEHAYAGYRIVEPGYFNAAGIHLIAGRLLDERDRLGAERVTVVSETMARKYWPGQDPLGKTVYSTSTEGDLTTDGAPPLRVVGVVNDVRQWGYESELMPEMYVSWLQVPGRTREMTLVARGHDNLAVMESELKREILDLDPLLTPDVTTMDAPFRERLRGRTLLMTILTGFGIAAVIIAAAGIFSLLAVAVTQRTREIGVRTALGATTSGIILHIVRPVLWLVTGGIGIGLVASFWASTLLRDALVDVTRTDTASLIATIGLLLLTALLAAALPALRAARTDPLTALRDA